MECDYIGHMDRHSFSGYWSKYSFIIYDKERYVNSGMDFINASNHHVCC